MKAAEVAAVVCALLVVAGILVFAVYMSIRARKKRDSQIRELCVLAADLERDPNFSSVANRISELIALPSLKVALHSAIVAQVWKQSVQFAVAHLELIAGRTLAYGALVPLSSLPGADLGQFLTAACERIVESPRVRVIHET